MDFSKQTDLISDLNSDHQIKAWNARAYGEYFFDGQNNDITTVEFVQGGDRFLTCSSDGSVRLFDTQSGEELAVLCEHNSKVYCAIVSPDKKHVVSGSEDGLLIVSYLNNEQGSIALNGHGREIWNIRFSPDGETFATASGDTTIKLWDWKTKTELFTLTGHTRLVRSLVISPDGKRMASGSDNGTVKIWDLETHAELVSFHCSDTWVTGLEFTSDGKRLIAASADGVIRIFDTPLDIEVKYLRGHRDIVTCSTFSPDEKLIASGSFDKTVRIWDRSTFEQLVVLDEPAEEIREVAFSPNGAYVQARNASGEPLATWEVGTWQLAERKEWDASHTRCRSKDGRWKLASSQNNVLIVDTAFRDLSFEKKFREQKAQIDVDWHREMAKQSFDSEDWFAAAFHAAWLVHAGEPAESQEILTQSVKKLQELYDDSNSMEEAFPAPIRKVIHAAGTIQE